MSAALVTGGAVRIGRGIVRHLAASGRTVAVHCYRSKREAAELVGALTDEGLSAFVVEGNLEDEREVISIVEEAEHRSGGLDVLVNNASVFNEDSVLDFEFGRLMENVMVNAYVPLKLARVFARNKRSANIVNLLDSRIVDYDSVHASYHLSKRMLDDITRMLAVELAPNIRVNAVAPGLILPPIGKDERYVEERKQELPLMKQGTVQQVCSALDFLIENEFVTGQTIYVDGGRHLKGAFYR